MSLSGVGPRHCTEEGIQLPAADADSAELGTPGRRAWTSGQRKDPAGRENPLDGLGRERQELGVEESSSRLSSSSEPPGLRLKPGNPLDTRHCFQTPLSGPRGCPAVWVSCYARGQGGAGAGTA